MLSDKFGKLALKGLVVGFVFSLLVSVYYPGSQSSITIAFYFLFSLGERQEGKKVRRKKGERVGGREEGGEGSQKEGMSLWEGGGKCQS